MHFNVVIRHSHAALPSLHAAHRLILPYVPEFVGVQHCCDTDLRAGMLQLILALQQHPLLR